MRPAVRFGILAAVVLAALFVPQSRRARAEASRRAARAQMAWVENRAGQILSLRRARETVAARERPEQDVLAEVSAVLADAGIPQARFAQLERSPDEPVRGAEGAGRSRYRRQSFQLHLSEITLRDLGAFLERWRARAALWTPSRIEIARAGRPAGASDRCEARIMVSAVYLADDLEAPR